MNKPALENGLARPEVKICGITTPAMARDCAAAGAEALGLMFVEASPRRVGVEAAREIVAELPAGTVPVGVFMNAAADEILRVCARTGIAVAQLHGDEPPDLPERLAAEGIGSVKRLNTRGRSLVDAADRFPAARSFLVECGAAPLGGGGGVAWDWSAAAPLKRGSRPFAVSGGVTPENVARALAGSGADGVDVSSGVEIRPGVKSRARVEAFVAAVAAAGGRPEGYRRVFSVAVPETPEKKGEAAS